MATVYNLGKKKSMPKHPLVLNYMLNKYNYITKLIKVKIYKLKHVDN